MPADDQHTPDLDMPDLDISEWRAAIDKHDDEILALIKSRLALSELVAKSKVRGGLAWRPAREAQLFARLAGRASATLSPQAVERLWSTVIAQSLQAQGPAFLLVPRTDPKLPHLARTFFGLLPLELVEDEAQAIARCAGEEGAIAIVPSTAEGVNWWLDLAQLNAGDAQGPAVLAALPRFARAMPVEAYAIAKAPREHTGNDTQFLVVEAQNSHRLAGTALAKNKDFSLMAMDGAYAPPDDIKCCQIGLFANPLAEKQ